MITLQYASYGRRLLATVLDCFIILIPCAIIGHIIPIVGGLAVLFFYMPIMESSELRATLGKHWMGLQVSDPQGRRLSLQAALLRNVLKILSPALLFVGCLIAFFNERRQTLHDILADSVVVFGRSDELVSSAWSQQVRGIFSRYVSQGESDKLKKLERLQALREKGALTPEEFEDEKRKILGPPSQI